MVIDLIVGRNGGGGWSIGVLRSTQQYIHGFVNIFDNFDVNADCLQNAFMSHFVKFKNHEFLFIIYQQIPDDLHIECNMIMDVLTFVQIPCI